MLFKPINCVVVALVSKVQALVTVKDYRPITCGFIA